MGATTLVAALLFLPSSLSPLPLQWHPTCVTTAHPTRTPAMPNVNCVVTLAQEANGSGTAHERTSREAIARRLAALLGCAFAGEHDRNEQYTGRVYFVPQATLLAESARRLDVRGPDDLFGGVVPYPAAATKAISHAALTGARVPPHWQHELAERLHGVVLRGHSAFDSEAVRCAGRLLLRHGRVRLKPAHLLGGAGQHVVADERELDAAVAALDARKLHDHGVVVEQNIESARTFSVGEVRVAATQIAYCGRQRVTRNHHGHEVYGGSDLRVVRGGLHDLLELDLEPGMQLAIWQALAYDRTVTTALAGFFASRRNYDVLQGRDGDGRLVSGVLEQSWRLGGASAAEIAALAALKSDAGLRAVRASTHEVYADAEPPPGADVLFDAIDPDAGRLLKYTLVAPGDCHA